MLGTDRLTTGVDGHVVPGCSEAQKSKTAGQGHQGPRLIRLLSSGLFLLPLGFKRAAAALDTISSFKTARRGKGEALTMSVSFIRKVKVFLAIPWTGARQAPLSMGFSRQEPWSG